MKKIMGLLVLTFILAVGIVGCSNGDDDKSTGSNESGSELADSMVWSVYSLGSGSYNDTSGIADALASEYGTNIRLLPSDTGIGRLEKLTNGTADYGVLGDEYVFSFEGTFDFAKKNWGPQDLRILWGPPTPLGLAVNGDAGIENIEDLKGKNVPHVIANDSVNQKMEAYLAYGGLTWDDVNAIEISYSDQANAFKAGQFDAIIMGPYGSALYEIENAVDIQWISVHPDDADGVDRIQAIAPQVVVAPFSDAAGMEDGEEVYGISYPTPFVTRADKSEEEVYNLIKAIDGQYENFKDTTLALSEYNLDHVLTEPLAVPFHAGVVKYFEENDVWSDEKEEKNNALIERQEKLQEGWASVLESADDENFEEEWLQWRNENLE